MYSLHLKMRRWLNFKVSTMRFTPQERARLLSEHHSKMSVTLSENEFVMICKTLRWIALLFCKFAKSLRSFNLKFRDVIVNLVFSEKFMKRSLSFDLSRLRLSQL